MSGKTLYDKIWDAHLVTQREDGTALIYIDRHLIHEVTSPQAFEGLRIAGRKPWRADANFATPDHNIPTTSAERRAGIDGILDPISKIQVTTLDDNCNEFGILEMNMDDIRQGIVHVVGPEQGATLPGMTIVCGDSHTSTHGALGALAHGIGTSEVEHVLATQCLMAKKAKKYARTGRRRAANRRDSERHRFGNHRQNRYGGWNRLYDRIWWRCHYGAQHRRPDDCV